MFILRRVTSRGHQSNQILGKSYSTLFEWQEGEENKKDYKAALSRQCHPDDVWAFIFNGGEEPIPLYKNSHYYVMCSDGKTFEKISST